MKLAGEEAAAFCRSPDLALSGALLFGHDEGLVAMRRRELVRAMLGQDSDPLRVTRLEPAAVRRDPAALDAALRARGFFGGRGVVLIERATDAVSAAFDQMMGEISPDDAFLVVTASALPGRSGLRRLFEGTRNLVALQIHAGVPTTEQIDARLRELGLRTGLDEEALELLQRVAVGIDLASFDRTLESVALYALDNATALRAKDISPLVPSGLDAELDAVADAVAEGRAESVPPLLRRVSASGASPVTLLLGLQRHFRQLLSAVAVEAGTDRNERPGSRPWGARRDAVRAQARRWRRDRLELASRLLYETDARVRSAERVPAMALVERCALRLALMAGR